MNRFLRVTCKRIYAFALAMLMVLSSVISDGMVTTKAATSASAVEFSEAKGYEEGAYAEWAPVEGADGYKAYVSKDGGAYTQVDNELIRKYADYWRVDAVGLAAGTYKIKVEAVTNAGDVVSSSETGNLTVSNYDRSGFAFSSASTLKTGSGAYNNDGTLKSNAQVIYVTADTAKTVKATVNGKEITGIQAIVDEKQKANTSNDVLCIRIIGTVTKNDLDKISSSSQGFQVKGNKAYTAMNITIEGIGEDATVSGFGFLVRYCGNVEFRNFAIMNYMDDGISVDTQNCNIWIHDMDFFYGNAGKDADQVKGDGTVDIKGNSQYITVSYNHFWDSGKASLCGSSKTSESGSNYLTFHHNWFDHSDSRHPRIRTMSVHVYNNYYDGVCKYGVGAAYKSDAFVEANYFNNCCFPMLTSKQGSDLYSNDDGGTFSGEDGGVIKAYNNIVVGAQRLVYQNSDAGTLPADAVEYDAYLVSSRSETVPSSIAAKQGGHVYNNFDTSMDLGVAESAITAPEDVPTVVSAKAGRLNGGDFTWDLSDPSEDTNEEVISALKTAVVNYTSSVESIGGITGGSTPDDGGSTEDSEESSEPAAPGTAVKHTFDARLLTTSADKEAMTNAEFTDKYFTVTGNVTKRGNSNGVNAVEVAKASAGAIVFTVTGTAEVTLGARSTGGSNTSAIAILNEAGTAMTNDQNASTVTSQSVTELTYTLPAGTYSIVSPPNSDYGRAAQVVYVDVIETIGDASEESTEAPTEPSEESTEAPTEPSEESSEVVAPSEPSFAEGDIYVSTTGKASGDGSYENPMDLVTAIESITAGHTIWMMDGTYKLYEQYGSTIIIPEANSGKEGAYKTISSINDGEVVLDFAGMSEASSNRGIVLDGSYWYFYGVDICNAGDNGMLLSGDYNVIEMCQFYNNHDSGLQLSRYTSSYNTVALWPSYNLIKNCTAFDNKDQKTSENADGFAAKLTCGEGNVFDGCIAYCNCDDGWDLYAKTDTGSIGVVTIKNCVAFGNGKTTDGTGSSNGDMNGFKLGGSGVPSPHIVENCLAFNNGATGFTDNNNGGAIKITNCTAANNGLFEARANYICYRASSSAVYTNLLSYAASTNGETDYFKGALDNVLYHYKGETKNNGYYWVDSHQASGAKEKYTGSEAADYTVTASDFVSTTVPGYNASKSTYETNYHEVFRDEDGNIDMNGLYELVETSPLRKAANDGGLLGSTFAEIVSEPSEPSEESSEAPSEPSEESSEAPGESTGKDLILNVTTDMTVSTISENTEVNGFTILATSDKTVSVDANTKTVDGVTYTQRLKLGGTGAVDARSIKFTTTGAATVNVIAISSSSSADRDLVLAENNNGTLTTVGTQTVAGAAVAKYSYAVDEAGTYQLHSASSGINIYYIEVVYASAPSEEPSEPSEESSEVPTEPSEESSEAPTEPSEESSEAPTEPSEESSEAPTEPSEESSEDSSEPGEESHKHSVDEDDWNYNYSSHWHNCSICDGVVGFEDHDWSDWKDIGNKEMQRKCADCGAKQVRDIPATGIPASGTSTQTSDNSNLMLWMMLFVVCSGVLVGMKGYSKKK